jgi:hypothetical protein
MAKRGELDRLTQRWRDRHDAQLSRAGGRPRATGGREALARRGFPYRDMTPAEYADQHADDMPGFTYDEESYADPELDAWLVELGVILRERREGAKKAASAPKAPARKAPAAKKAPPAKKVSSAKEPDA